MNYSTLKEVYNIDTFEKKKKKVKTEEVEEGFEEQTPYKSNTPKITKTQPMNNIQPYYDEELEQYLNINEFKNEIPYGRLQQSQQVQYQPNNQSTNQVQDIPIHQIQQVKYQPSNENIPQFIQQKEQIQYNTNFQPQNTVKMATVPNENTADKPSYSRKTDIFYKNLINIGIFIFIGILIIFMCEQITEIAINIGMRRTYMLLEPYLCEKRP